MVLEILKSCATEEAKASSIVIPAIYAARPNAAIAGLKENCRQAFDQALPHFDLGIVPEEVPCLDDLPHLLNSLAIKSSLA